MRTGNPGAPASAFISKDPGIIQPLVAGAMFDTSDDKSTDGSSCALILSVQCHPGSICKISLASAGSRDFSGPWPSPSPTCSTSS